MIFWLAIVLMFVVALAMLLPALAGRKSVNDIDRASQSVSAARQRLAELKISLEQGTIEQDEYKNHRDELELTLLEDMRSGEKTAGQDKNRNVVWSAIIAVFVPIVTVGFYLAVGTPLAILAPESLITQANGKPDSVEQPSPDSPIKSLQARVQQNPNDAESWGLLGRNFMAAQQYQSAAEAFGQLHALQPDDDAVAMQYAGALALSRNSFAGEPQTLIDEVLERNPQFPQALWLAGMSARVRGEVDAALGFWHRLRDATGPYDPFYTQVNALIAEIEQSTGVAVSAPEQSRKTKTEQSVSITLNIALAGELLNQARPDATVFVFARAVQGPRMPLAVVRKQVKDLPFTTMLDDSMAMTPALKLSDFDKVEIIARVSKTGEVKGSSGDLEGRMDSVKVSGNSTHDVVIDQIIQ